MSTSTRKLRRLIALAFSLAAAAAGAQALYWEAPLLRVPSGVSYSASAASGDLLVVSWQERTGAGAAAAVNIWMETARLGEPGTDTQWSAPHRVHGPIPLGGVMGIEPRMHALAMKDGRVMVAIVLPSTTGRQGATVLIMVSDDGGVTFRETARFQTETAVTSPNLSVTARGGWLLMLTRPEQIPASEGVVAQEKLSIAWSVSDDGSAWSPLAPLIPETDLRQNIQPYHVAMGGTDYVVFQSKYATTHLYLKRSDNLSPRAGDRAWGPAIPITSQESFAEAAEKGTHVPDDFSNQRPCLLALDGRLGLAWERSLIGTEQSQIYYCEIDGAGKVVRPPERVSLGENALFAQLFSIGGLTRLLYTERRLGGGWGLALATRDTAWSVVTIGPQLPAAGFSPHADVLQGRLYAFYETQVRDGWALYALRPDTSASSPSLRPVDFQPGAPANRDRVTVTWDEPPDPSRIRRYRYSWSLQGSPPQMRELSGASQALTLDAPTDGTWNLAVWSIDGAGNVSPAPAEVSFTRDATPPGQVALFLDPPPESDGFQPSNDFAISWVPPSGDRIARYEVNARIPVEGGSVDRRPDSLRITNADDGEYTVKVSAVDFAGNVGPAAAVTVRLNRYRPVTIVSAVTMSRDAEENLHLELIGRGFTVGGKVQEVILDRDGKPPYDVQFSLAGGQFTVPDDRHVNGVTLGVDVPTGDYFVGVRHPVRQVHFAAQRLSYVSPGTVKIGNFSFRWAPRWAASQPGGRGLSFAVLLVVLFGALVAVALLTSSRRLAAVAHEGSVLKAEVRALLENRPPLLAAQERARKLQALQRRGVGLTVKYTLLVGALVVLIVLGVAVPLAVQMLGAQQRILAERLRSRATLLVDSAAARAAEPLQRGASGYAAVASIPSSVSIMPGEALYLSVTGPGDPGRRGAPPSEDPTDRDYVWATNDPMWPEGSFAPGWEHLGDESLTSQAVAGLAAALNTRAAGELADILARDRTLSADVEQRAKSLSARPTAEELASYNALRDESERVKAEGRGRLLALAKAPGMSGSKPEFDARRLATEYLFYRPIVALVQDGRFFQGMVRLRISTVPMRDTLNAATRELVETIGLISLAAVLLGMGGAVFLARTTIRPVRKLAKGVKHISETEDKSDLKGYQIEVGTRDEIGTLAASVNAMTQGLVQAAEETRLLKIGQDVQQRFLPLAERPGGGKGCTGSLKTAAADIFGYYQGAKGVSGDYFDFQKLDDRHYALINCDVSGKGVPAALIMVEVATLFITWCRDWKRLRWVRGRRATSPTRVRSLVTMINDMLVERSFEGRFAALTVGVLDVESGTLTACPAGSAELHRYDAASRTLVKHELPDTPAAGVFPTVLVEGKGGFQVVEISVGRGDAMFMFSDGFTDSRHFFRTYLGEEVPCQEPGLQDDQDHDGTHKRGGRYEDFGLGRMEAVVTAALNRGTYRLVRSHPSSDELLEFDFSGGAGSVREAVLAMVAVERVFRLYRDDGTGVGDTVSMPEEIDEFLRRHFRQYSEWFSNRLPAATPGTDVIFTHLKEEAQYDDLTLLAMGRP